MRSLIVLLVGFPGTGKTTVAYEIAKSLEAIVLTTEVIRERLLSEGSILEDRDFTLSELDLIYKVTALLTHYHVISGKNVIVDGVFRSQEQRQSILNIASNTGAGILPIHVICSETVILKRLGERKAIGTISPSGPSTYWKLKQDFEDIDNTFFQIDTTDNNLKEQINRILDTYYSGA